MNIVRTDVFMEEGDSIVDPAYPYQSNYCIKQRIVGHYANPTGAPYNDGPPAYPAGGLRAPVFVNCAISGSTTNEILARMPANLAKNAYTGLWINDGVNDGALIRDGSMTMKQFTDNVTAIYALAKGAGMTKGFWTGPMCNGEKYPSGQNTAGEDPFLDDIDAELAALIPSFAGGGFTSDYVPTRAAWALLEPQFNTAANGYADPHGLTNGPLCTPLISPSTIEGLHQNRTGCMYINIEQSKKIFLT